MITNTYSVIGSIQLVEPKTNSIITLHAGDTFKHELADDGTSTILHKEKSYRFDKIYTRAIESVIGRHPQIFEKTWVEDNQDDDMDIHWGYKLADLVTRLNGDGVEVVSVSEQRSEILSVQHQGKRFVEQSDFRRVLHRRTVQCYHCSCQHRITSQQRARLT